MTECKQYLEDWKVLANPQKKKMIKGNVMNCKKMTRGSQGNECQLQFELQLY